VQLVEPRVPTARDWSERLTQAARRVDTNQGVVECADRNDGPALFRVQSCRSPKEDRP
jgi:hypothetical protein